MWFNKGDDECSEQRNLLEEPFNLCCETEQDWFLIPECFKMFGLYDFGGVFRILSKDYEA